MKIFIFSILIAANIFAQSSWQILKEATLPQTYSACFFITEDKGWLGGSDGIIYYTENGGATWIIQRDTSSTYESINDIFFLDENNGWVCGTEGSVFYTTNGGTSWNAATTVPTTLSLEAINFINTSVGYACGSGGTIIKSTDGGKNWIAQVSTVTANLGDISFWDVSKGFAIINSNVNGVLWTETGGFVWNTTTLPIPSGSSSSRMYGCDAIVGTSTGFIAGYHGNIFKTTDNGKNWQHLISLFGSDFAQVRDIDFSDSQTGFAVGSSGGVFKTSDGGTTWDTLSCGSAQTMTKVVMVDNQTSIISGLNSQLRKTTDGGAIWTPMVNWPRVSFRGMGIADSLNIVAGSFGGDLTHSNDGGQQFTFPGNENIPSAGNIGCVYFYNSQLGFYGAQDGIIARTIDGGATWSNSNVTGSASPTVYSISMYDMNTGWAGGSSGIIYKTTNGGINWTQIQDVGGDIFYDMQFLTDQIGFGVTNQGNIFKCSDGNTNWSIVANFPFDFYGLDFIDSQNGFAIGEDGLLVKTTQGGDSWEIADTLGFWVSDSFYLPDLRDIQFVNASEGWITGRYGSIFKTIDSGKSWQYVASQTNNTLYQVNFLSPDIGFAAGDNGTILGYGITTFLENPEEIYFPKTVNLKANYPNPFNPSTNIEYFLNYPGLVELSIFDLQGRHVRTLNKAYQNRGSYRYLWDGTNKNNIPVSSGMYVYQLKIDESVHARRMVLIK